MWMNSSTIQVSSVQSSNECKWRCSIRRGEGPYRVALVLAQGQNRQRCTVVEERAGAGVARQQVGVGRLDSESSLVGELIHGGEGEVADGKEQ